MELINKNALGYKDKGAERTYILGKRDWDAIKKGVSIVPLRTKDVDLNGVQGVEVVVNYEDTF